MREAVVASAARAPISKARRGAFNLTSGASLASFAVKAAVQRAGISPTQIEDAIMGRGYPAGSTGPTSARQAVIRAGLPNAWAAA